MKRHLGVLLAIVLLGTLVGVALSPINAAGQTATWGGTYQIGLSGTQYIANSITSTSGNVYYPAAGYKFAGYNLTLTNINAPDLYLGNPGYFKLSTSSGTAYSYSSDTFLLATPMRGVDHTTPGEKVHGWIVFEIARSDTPTQILYNDGQSWVLVPINYSSS
jgi:Domain of unknown function (DUF4352)